MGFFFLKLQVIMSQKKRLLWIRTLVPIESGIVNAVLFLILFPLVYLFLREYELDL